MRRIAHGCRRLITGSFLLLIAWAITTLAEAAPFMPIREVRDLGRAALATNPTVHVQGLITCADPQYEMIFVQDDTAGIFLFRYSPTLDLSPGDRVQLQALAAKGRFSPILDSAQVLRVEKGSLPVPPRVPFSRVIAGELDGQRVEVQGMVERVVKRGDHLWLNLAAGNNLLSVAVPLAGHAVPEILDTRVQVRGVVASYFRQDTLVGFQMFANGLADVEIVERPVANAFELPVCPVRELSHFNVRRTGAHRVHVRGVVSLHWPGRATVLQDDTNGLILEGGVVGDLKVGDEVDAVGFIVPGGGANRLRHAEVRVRESGREIPTVPVTVSGASSAENRLVRMVGRVVEWQPHRQGEALALLSSGNDLFTGVLRDAGAERARALFTPGALVSLTGVIRPASEVPGSRPAIWLRTASDLTLLRAPPPSPWQWVVIAAVIAAAVAAAGAGAVLFLLVRHRRSVAGMNAKQQESEQMLEEMERQFRRAHRDREFIAQELHDNIVQSIFSVGLGIDEARRLAQKSPERVEERLDVAVQALNKIIRDVRAFIGGLEPKGLEGHELKTALKSVLLASGEDQEARFSLQIDASAARELTSMQATEVFNIAKEAMANAMRHSNARLTTVSLVPRGRGVRLEVADDGMGFDSDRTDESGMGLRNIRNRARNIGAKLDIISAPGHGTRIVADIPISTHDDH